MRFVPVLYILVMSGLAIFSWRIFVLNKRRRTKSAEIQHRIAAKVAFLKQQATKGHNP